MDVQGISTLAIIAGLGLAAVGPGIGMGIATAAAINAVARQPEVEGRARNMLLLGIVFMEVLVIYAILGVLLCKYVFKLF
ncbi:MAG: ATP F0F1 synthase subunit C [bacterium]